MSNYLIAYRTVRPHLNGYLHLSGMGAVFEPAFDVLSKNEGFYANHPDDLGKETYAGIARAFYPLWEGWAVLDRYKRNLGRDLFPNEYVPGLEPLVRQFYEIKFRELMADKIVNQDVANIFFDFYILAARAVATMQEVLRSMGQKIEVDNQIGKNTIDAINSVNPAKLHSRFKEARLAYHKDRVNRGVVSPVFLPGWIKRTLSFPDLWKKPPIAGMVAVAACGTAAFFLLYPPANEWIKTKYKTLVA